jgi:hypothetical protein
VQNSQRILLEMSSSILFVLTILGMFISSIPL